MMAADYRHIGGVENRLGRHYSRFSPFWPAASFADQSLALRKSWNAGSNRRSQVRVTACHRRHRFPSEIIQHAIWLYLRFTLSYRDVEELLAEQRARSLL